MKKVFIDGQHGTTGLRINELIQLRDDVEILKIDPEKRKDFNERKKYLNQADIVFLCLPDDASKEAVSMIENSNTCVIDASTAFRTNPNWIYGLPELNKEQREKIKNSKRISVPGCHATGFNILVYPLVSQKLISDEEIIVAHSITGFSGGGKKMIETYEENKNNELYLCPRPYALTLNHKHIPEMQKVSGLKNKPIFMPVVSNFYNGMLITIPIHKKAINRSLYEVWEFFKEYYKNEIFINVMPLDTQNILKDGFIDPIACKNTNRLEIFVLGNDEQILLAARFDNLGKGASGAAIQCFNIVTGVQEDKGLKR